MSRILDRRAGGSTHPLYDPRFDDASLTEAINVKPYNTGRPAQLGIFVDTPIARTKVRLGITDRTITVIPSRQRGGETNLAARAEQRGIVEAVIPHFPLLDTMTPADIQDLGSFDPSGALVAVEDAYAQKLDDIRQRHDHTHHYLDWGALNGEVLDAEGKILFDLFTTFDLEQHSVAFDLDTSTFDVAAANRSAKAILRKELRGTAASGAIVLAGKDFYDRYVGHQSVKNGTQFYAGSTPNPARDDIEERFTFAGLTLERIDEEYNIRQPNGAIITRPAIVPDEALLIPLGTSFFRRYIAPPDTVSGANRPPEPATKIHISTEDMPHDKGREIHSESNVLPICVQPQTMIRFVLGK